MIASGDMFILGFYLSRKVGIDSCTCNLAPNNNHIDGDNGVWTICLYPDCSDLRRFRVGKGHPVEWAGGQRHHQTPWSLGERKGERRAGRDVRTCFLSFLLYNVLPQRSATELVTVGCSAGAEENSVAVVRVPEPFGPPRVEPARRPNLGVWSVRAPGMLVDFFFSPPLLFFQRHSTFALHPTQEKWRTYICASCLFCQRRKQD